MLSGNGDKTVVGRTPGVQGQIAIDGTVVTGGRFLVDMTGLITDSGARTSAMRSQAIETDAFPTASFELTAPLDFARIPGGGEQVTVTAAGDLTVHGVTRAVEMPLTAELQSGVIVVVGQLELALVDYGIDAPSARSWSTSATPPYSNSNSSSPDELAAPSVRSVPDASPSQLISFLECRAQTRARHFGRPALEVF